MSAEPLRIAMWSGPRNISTALLRAWGQRADTIVVDEPLYAHYLKATGLDHPGADEVIARHEPDWHRAVAGLLGPLPEGKRILFQKHMAHHLLPEIDRFWIGQMANAFLIRDPREMLPSLARVLPRVTLADTGLPQQVEIFDWVREHLGTTPPVVDARDVLEDPPGMLSRLCEALGVPFDEAMLSWPPGPRDTDGVWGKHWYANVYESTTFAPYVPRDRPIPEHLEGLLDRCNAYYDALHQHRLGR